MDVHQSYTSTIVSFPFFTINVSENSLSQQGVIMRIYDSHNVVNIQGSQIIVTLDKQ